MFHVCWEPKPGYCYNRVPTNFESRVEVEREACYIQDENPECGNVWVQFVYEFERHEFVHFNNA